MVNKASCVLLRVCCVFAVVSAGSVGIRQFAAHPCFKTTTNVWVMGFEAVFPAANLTQDESLVFTVFMTKNSRPRMKNQNIFLSVRNIPFHHEVQTEEHLVVPMEKKNLDQEHLYLHDQGQPTKNIALFIMKKNKLSMLIKNIDVFIQNDIHEVGRTTLSS